jgi:hypothetical protein
VSDGVRTVDRNSNHDEGRHVMKTATVKPIEAQLEKDVTVQLGSMAIEGLRREQIRALHDALQRVKQAEEDMPEFTSDEARGALEDLGTALREADTAASALWWMSPGVDPEHTLAAYEPAEEAR